MIEIIFAMLPWENTMEDGMKKLNLLKQNKLFLLKNKGISAYSGFSVNLTKYFNIIRVRLAYSDFLFCSHNFREREFYI